MQTYNEQLAVSQQKKFEYTDHSTVNSNNQGFLNEYLSPVRQLEEYTSELEIYLKQHVAGIQSLLRDCKVESGASYSPSGNFVARDQTSSQAKAIQGHVQAIQQFLARHIINVEALQTALNNTKSSLQEPSFHPGRLGEVGGCKSCADGRQIATVQTFEREDHSSSYSTVVLMSTFTAGLIVAYLQLMYDMLPPVDSLPTEKAKGHYRVGFGIGFVSLVLNLCVAIVAVANTASRRGDSPRSNQDSSPEDPSLELQTYNVIVGHGSATTKSAPEMATSSGDNDIGTSQFKQKKDHKNNQSVNNLSVKERFARRSVAFAFAQFVGAGTFGICIGTLLYVHSGHRLAMVPMVLLTGSLFMAGWDLIRGLERSRRKKLD